MSKIRLERVNSEMKRNLSEILCGGLRDVELTAMTTVMYVEVTSDLEHAKVGLSIFGSDDEKRRNFDAICSAKGQIKRELSARMKHMRMQPDLHFELDESLDYSERINRVLNEIKRNER